MKKYILITFCIISQFYPGYSQESYEHISNSTIYHFLDELASEQVIIINSAIKPFTRKEIYNFLGQAIEKQDELNARQKKELYYFFDFYRFGNEAGYLPLKARINLFKKQDNWKTSMEHASLLFRDSVFSFSLRPVLGIEYTLNGTENFRKTYGGLETFASLGRNLSVYASLREIYQTGSLLYPDHFISDLGGNYKFFEGTKEGEYSEMRGGIILGWEWGRIGVIKDHLQWGDNNNGSIILSGRTPSFPMIMLHLSPSKWLHFNYFHAWLVSEVIDSVNSYITTTSRTRNVYRPRYMAANMFTIKPYKGIHFSFGNSIVYSDMDVNPAYFIPVFFYKSVDHTLNHGIENQNSQLFFNLSMRMINHLHVYTVFYFDELAFRRFKDPDEHNFYSYKVGGTLSNWPVSNLFLSSEYTRTSPYVYKHRIPSLKYESNRFNLGYYLRDNSEELYFSLSYKPLARFYSYYEFSFARHGNEYEYVDGNIAVTKEFMEEITWEQMNHSLGVNYELLTNVHAFAGITFLSTKTYDVDNITADYYLNLFTPEFYQGNKSILRIGFRAGF
ncbi:hypothetical protein ACFLSA_01600 [Bacteroidota bacterium]